MTLKGKIGYIGVDVLNNATVCNEAMGLLEAGAPLELVSVRRHDAPAFYRSESLRGLTERLGHLYPLPPLKTVWDLVRAPWMFGGRFWRTAWRALTCPAEGVKQRVRLVGHLVPAIALATRWRGQDIVHIHAHWAHTATTIAMHAADLLGAGFSFTGHANDLFVHCVGLRTKVHRARFVVCISEFHRRFYLERGGDPERMAIVYCGIDEHRFARGGRENQASIPTGRTPTIVSVGRLVEKKGFADLIRACALLRDRGLAFHCRIAGGGPLLEPLRALAAELKLNDWVELTGETALQEDLPELLGSADVFALPCVRDSEGDMDGLPQVLIEAMLLGVPAVSTRLVGIPDLVRHEENGLLVEPGGVTALADALERLLGDPKLAEAFGERAESWAREHFRRSKAIERMSALFAWASAVSDPSLPLPEELRFPPSWEDDEAAVPEVPEVAEVPEELCAISHVG